MHVQHIECLYTPNEMLDNALRKPRGRAPSPGGKKWRYSLPLLKHTQQKRGVLLPKVASKKTSAILPILCVPHLLQYNSIQKNCCEEGDECTGEWMKRGRGGRGGEGEEEGSGVCLGVLGHAPTARPGNFKRRPHPAECIGEVDFRLKNTDSCSERFSFVTMT